jgi:hypothetical protein
MISINFLYAQQAQDSNTLICEVLGEGSKRIQCTFFTSRVNYDRNITFEWKSPSIGKDDRTRMIILNANYGSLYDFRYYYGRSPGEWHVSVKDGNITLSDTTFIIQEHDDEEY